MAPLNRLRTLRRDLVLILVASCAVISLMEFWLLEVPANSRLTFHAGQLLLKLSYSYVSAFLFFFLVVHLPREKRRLRSSSAIRYHLMRLEIEISTLIAAVYLTSGEHPRSRQRNSEDMAAACQRVHAQMAMCSTIDSDQPFTNWYAYLHFKQTRIRRIVSDLLAIGEGLDADLIEPLIALDKWVYMYMNFERGGLANETLGFAAPALYETESALTRLQNIFEKNYGIYAMEG